MKIKRGASFWIYFRIYAISIFAMEVRICTEFVIAASPINQLTDLHN